VLWSAGYRDVGLLDVHTGTRFALSVFYPSGAREQPESLGRYRFEVALNARPAAGEFALVVISHGGGGTPLVYRTLARHLARNGFVVGLPTHPFNNVRDNSWQGKLENLRARPALVHGVLDWFFADPEFGPLLKPGVAAVVGHSMGGYTALAAAGGVATALAHEPADGNAREVGLEPDPRITALVLLAPATVWFSGEDALRRVNLPVLMLSAERDELTPAPHAQIVVERLPDKAKLQHRVVPNAGHFSFLAPFPEVLTKPSFPPSQDPPGFDRVAFLEELNLEVTAFLRQALQEKAAEP